MKDIPGFEGLYGITKDGRVFNLNRKRRIATCVGSRRYVMVNLWKENQMYARSVHRLLAIVYIPNPESKRTVNHKNGIKTDISIKNLEWNTYSENVLHAYRTGLAPNMRENHAWAKLSDKEVSEIRSFEYFKGCTSIIGRQYGVRRQYIYRIMFRETRRYQ